MTVQRPDVEHDRLDGATLLRRERVRHIRSSTLRRLTRSDWLSSDSALPAPENASSKRYTSSSIAVIEHPRASCAITQWNVTSPCPRSISLRVSESSSSNPASRSARSFASGSKPGEEHRDAEPVLLDLVVGVARAEREHEPPARPEPREHPREHRRVLGARQVVEDEERDDRVERLERELDRREVRLDERGVRESLASERELPRREVDPRVPPAVGERGRHRRRPASELEHVGVRRQPLEDLVEEPLADARPLRRRPLQVAASRVGRTLFDRSVSGSIAGPFRSMPAPVA